MSNGDCFFESWDLPKNLGIKMVRLVVVSNMALTQTQTNTHTPTSKASKGCNRMPPDQESNESVNCWWDIWFSCFFQIRLGALLPSPYLRSKQRKLNFNLIDSPTMSSFWIFLEHRATPPSATAWRSASRISARNMQQHVSSPGRCGFLSK